MNHKKCLAKHLLYMFCLLTPVTLLLWGISIGVLALLQIDPMPRYTDGITFVLMSAIMIVGLCVCYTIDNLLFSTLPHLTEEQRKNVFLVFLIWLTEYRF